MERVKKEEAEVRKGVKLKVSLEKRMRQEAVLRAPWATGIKQKIRNLSGLHEADPGDARGDRPGGGHRGLQVPGLRPRDPPDGQQGDQAMPEAEFMEMEQHDMGEGQGFDWQGGEEDFMDQTNIIVQERDPLH
eukprot:11796460-Heterocapsa_arctica.AAC.1